MKKASTPIKIATKKAKQNTVFYVGSLQPSLTPGVTDALARLNGPPSTHTTPNHSNHSSANNSKQNSPIQSVESSPLFAPAFVSLSIAQQPSEMPPLSLPPASISSDNPTKTKKLKQKASPT